MPDQLWIPEGLAMIGLLPVSGSMRPLKQQRYWGCAGHRQTSLHTTGLGAMPPHGMQLEGHAVLLVHPRNGHKKLVYWDAKTHQEISTFWDEE